MIDGQARDFVPVRDFRREHSLPDDFGITRFYEKDYTGRGSIQGAGEALNALRHDILNRIPQGQPPQGWLTFSLELQLYFHRKLREINPHIGLRQSEIEYAVAGFGDVSQAFIQAAMSARMTGKPLPTFEQIYERWLNSAVLTSKQFIPYQHQNQEWRIYLVKYIYGLAGMIVETAQERFYVYDPALACPAEGFMSALLNDVTERILSAMN
jgi:hypothetical protein